MAVQAEIDIRDPDNGLALAAWVLRGDRERWRHSKAVAERAWELAAAVPATHRALLVTAAWLHDIGYAEPVRTVGFHPLDGARWLCSQGYDQGVAALVAHHSGARFVAATLGLQPEMEAFPFREDPLTDALTTADQTVGPNGRRMSVEERIADMLRRHGPDSPNGRAHGQRGPYLRKAVHRTLERLSGVGVQANSWSGWRKAPPS